MMNAANAPQAGNIQSQQRSFTLVLPNSSLELLVQATAELPYKQVAHVIQDVVNQVQKQLEEEAQKSAAAAAEDRLAQARAMAAHQDAAESESSGITDVMRGEQSKDAVPVGEPINLIEPTSPQDRITAALKGVDLELSPYPATYEAALLQLNSAAGVQRLDLGSFDVRHRAGEDVSADYAPNAQLITRAMQHLDEALPNGQAPRATYAFKALSYGVYALGTYLRSRGLKV